MSDFCYSLCFPWGSGKPSNLLLSHKSMKVPCLDGQVLIHKNKKKVSYSSGLPLWPLAAQNKIWFLKSNASACYFSSLTLRWRTWRCLTDILDPRILREVSALPEHITKVWEVRNTIHHSLIHPSIIHPSSIHHPSIIHPSIHPSFLSLIFPFISFYSLIYSLVPLDIDFFIHSILIKS